MGPIDWQDHRIVPKSGGKPTNPVAEGITTVILFGGTFDPPHIGHLMMAQLALEQVCADGVWFLPAPVPPHKTKMHLSDYRTRNQLVETLIAGMAGMFICDVEASLPVPSYTVDTVKEIQRLYPGIAFQFLIGSDTLAQLPTWRHAGALCERIPFLVAARAGYPFAHTLAAVQQQLPALRATVVEMPLIDVSSTFVRDRLSRGLPVCGLVPEPVLKVWRQDRPGCDGRLRDGGSGQ